MILTYYTATTMIVIAYLLGSIPSAVWIGKKYYGIDIREHGSKNAGTTNMLRVLGRRSSKDWITEAMAEVFPVPA